MYTLVKALSVSALCMAGFGVVHAADPHDQKQVAVCKKKSEGAQVSYAHKGVIYNGTCQPSDNGKLKFKPPMPAANAPAPISTPVQMQENQSAPYPVQDAPKPMVQPAPAPQPVQ